MRIATTYMMLLSLLLQTTITMAQSPIATSDSSLHQLKYKVEGIANRPEMKRGQWGFALVDGSSGALLLEHRSHETMVPASTQKTITSAAALGMLGTDYTFKTVLEHDGAVQNGQLVGNLYIRGGGDPTLGSDRFGTQSDLTAILLEWGGALKRAGVSKVEGSIVGDAEFFEDATTPSTWNWGDIGNYYGAGANGLSVLENTYEVFFDASGKVGSLAKFIGTNPTLPGIRFWNEMKIGTSDSGDQGYVYGAPFDENRYLRGSVPQGKGKFSIKGSLPDPALFIAERAKQVWDSLGIHVSGKPTTTRIMRLGGMEVPGKRLKIAEHQSPPLEEIVYWLNKKSINLYAEHLLKTMGKVKFGEGTQENGLKAMTEFWSGKGLNLDGLYAFDGSGLSRYNGVTPLQLATMMRLNISAPYFEAFWESLPIAGDPNDPGTIKSMCLKTAAAKNVRAKSGSIARVRCYTGYANTSSGKRVCFAMMANNYSCSSSEMRDWLADLMVAIAELP
jgi:D-alanyl-D-alanine carboxypeptidase/D-alanyl-D-alanine-endopeptidase (penicillin-binding protein 4)